MHGTLLLKGIWTGEYIITLFSVNTNTSIEEEKSLKWENHLQSK